MALFGKKKSTEEVPSGITDGGWRPQPDKAAKFFEHARTVAQTGNYSYAIDMYARGLRFEPDNMESHIALYETAVRYFNSNGKPASGKEIRAIDGPNPADKMAVAEFAWAKDINNLALAMKLMAAIGKADEKEFGQWLAPRMFAYGCSVRRVRTPLDRALACRA